MDLKQKLLEFEMLKYESKLIFFCINIVSLLNFKIYYALVDKLKKIGKKD